MAEEHNAIKYGVTISQAAAIASGGAYSDVGVSRLSETLTPTMDLWSRREWELLRGEIMFGRALTSPVVAARFSSIELVNPAGNTKLCVVRGIVRFGGAAGIDFSVDSGAALGVTTTNRGVALDRRFPQLGETSTCTLVIGDLAAGAANVQWSTSTSVPASTVPLPWVLPPGSKLFMVSDTAATAIFLNIFFSERSPFPGELQARG